ncbi:MAG: SpoIIE family protein phosphatase, partial [Acidobacteria bacterium]|nr:SpoIIE family protein phosphatase [Acidobacteriota bacterium]
MRRVFQRQRFREAYDERSILADLSLAARAVTTREQLFKLFVSRIQEALRPTSVAIFVRDDASGDYRCEIISELTPASGGGAEATACYETCDLVLSRDAFVVRRLTKLAIPLTVSAEDYQSWMRALAAATPARREARRRESETLARIQAALLVPVMMKNEEVGIISLGAREGGQPYSEESKQLLFSIAGQMAFVIENTKLAARIVEEERLRREIEMATEAQRRLFPEAAPARRALDLAGSCQPARGVGGDYYDFLVLDDHQTGVAVADVAGKGISAALLMSIVQASLRSQVASAKEGSLAELVSNMNQLMRRSTGAASFATFFYAQFDDRTKSLTYVNAGHNPPLLWRAAQSEQAAAANGMKAAQEVARARAVGAISSGSVAVVEESDSALAATERLTEGGPVIGVLS